MTGGENSLFAPVSGIAIDVSSVDADLTILWPSQGYARSIWVGVAGTLNVTYLDGTTTSHTVPQGEFMGCFITVKHSGTSASGLVARL